MDSVLALPRFLLDVGGGGSFSSLQRTLGFGGVEGGTGMALRAPC